MYSSEKKLLDKYLKDINSENVDKYFGDWINNIDQLKEKFLNANPFEHVIIPNFLNSEYANQLEKLFPVNFDKWHKYWNPIEVKYANDDINNLPEEHKKLFYLLSSDRMTNIISQISDISDLQYDEYLHGAGLHAHPRGGRLNLHLDYEKHPITGKQRRLNIILYMNKDWNDEWHGESELWNNDVSECVVKSKISFNTALIFKTNEISWHGVPEPIMCPENMFRKSIAYYYVSELVDKQNKNKVGNDGSGFRSKATFVKRPSDPYDENMQKLYDIRPIRRIEKKDMDELFPNWKPN